MGCEKSHHIGRLATNCFNPRTRVGCEDDVKPLLITGNRFQSTHPCGVRSRRLDCDSVHDVSIHAPVWGANLPSGSSKIKTVFQSTHPCGVRTESGTTVEATDVSIHAPVWGANDYYHKNCNVKSFNPRTRVGCEFLKLCPCGLGLFQSTHPCGVRKDKKCNE